jgi:CopG family nickel-responsive transcriptional regulator
MPGAEALSIDEPVLRSQHAPRRPIQQHARLDSRAAPGNIINCEIRNTEDTRPAQQPAPIEGNVSSTPATQLARLSVSLPEQLLEQLDVMVQERGLPSRSQMLAELIRHELAEHGEKRTSSVLAGTITLIYRAESGRVRQALARTQSSYIEEVISSQHVLLEDDQSLEVLLVQGPARRLRSLCDDLRKVRGVQQIKLVTTTALLPPLHSHGAVDGGTANSRTVRVSNDRSRHR